MKRSRTAFALQSAFVLIVLSAAAPLRAEDRFSAVLLDVCNKGTVPVVAVTTMKYADVWRGLGKYSWQITTKVIPSGKCRNVYYDAYGDGAELAFVFQDAKGQWGAGKVAQVPDFGKYVVWFQSWPILSRSDGKTSVCAPRWDTSYKVDDNPKIDCATMKLKPIAGTPEVQGPFIPVTSVLHFEDERAQCFRGPPLTKTLVSCDFYLDVSPGGTDRELHAMEGTGDGVDADPPMTDAQLLKAFSESPLGKALAKAAAEERQKQDQAAAAAAAERQRQAYANSPEGRLQHARELQAAREQKQKQILAADAAGNPDAKIPAQMIRREEENNRQRWAGTRQSPAAYDPRWMGQNVAIVGTVSRVEVDPDGSPHWVTIYFKESPDAAFVVCSPYPDLFQERVGLNLNSLVGKTLEAAGQVESPYCGGKASKGSIRVVGSKQWQVH